MKKNGFSFFTLFMLYISLSLSGQNSVRVEVYPYKTVTLAYEKFDINTLRSKVAKSGSIDYAYMKADGTHIQVSCQRIGEPIEVYETPPFPAIHKVFKEFYPNGNLKQTGVYLPRQFAIGKWLEYDEYGGATVINHEIGRDTFGYNDIFKILENKGYINTRNEADNWDFLFWYNEFSRQWGVKLQKDRKYKMLHIDAQSGTIIGEEDYEVIP